MTTATARADTAMRAGADDRVLPTALVSVMAGLGALVIFELIAWGIAGGFEYPLDDTYIHLAMAENIGRGGYGINAGEYASASSSVLWPFLLVPLAASEAGRYLPLALNALALMGLCLCWGYAVARARLSRPVTLALAIVGPVALNMYGVAALGMEHSLHALLTVLVVLGLGLFFDERRATWWLIVAIVLAPLVRFEGMALSLVAATILALRGQWRVGLAAALATVAASAAFMVFLHSIGLSMLPSSVLAKSAQPGGSFVIQRLIALVKNIGETPGVAVLLLSVLMLVLAFAAPLRRGGRYLLPAGLGLVGIAHMIFGRIGWGARYENYVVTAMVFGLLVCVRWGAGEGTRGRVVTGIAGLLTVLIGLSWQYTVADHEIAAPRAVSLQQRQMARFVQDYWRGPVAVNDLGYVSWRNPHYVLDLWGLGAQDALETRLDPDHAIGWADPLVRKRGVGLAMIYDQWLKDAVGRDWQWLGTLEFSGNLGLVLDPAVSFYATSPEEVAPLQEKLRAFVPTLPEGARFVGPAVDTGA